MVVEVNNEEYFLVHDKSTGEYLLVNTDYEVVYRGTYTQILYWLDKEGGKDGNANR